MHEYLSYFHGEPKASAKMRVECEDFKVFENLSFEPVGSGYHSLVSIRKTNRNTQDVLSWLAETCAASERDIGYCGQKDKRAITEQWFSVPGNDVEESLKSADSVEGIEVLSIVSHDKKLRLGAHRSNTFEIVLKEFEGNHDDVKHRLQSIQQTGFPNYFGPQRFGRDGKNAIYGRMLLQNKRFRKAKGVRQKLQVSALRSQLFNTIVSLGLSSSTYHILQEHDVLMIDGSHSHFVADHSDDLELRLKNMSVHKTAPLWGRPDRHLPEPLYQRELELLSDCQEDALLLESRRFDMTRRAIRAVARNLEWKFVDSQLILKFELDPGVFATSLLREFVKFEVTY